MTTIFFLFFQLFCFDAASGYCVSYRPAAEGSRCGDGQVTNKQKNEQTNKSTNKHTKEQTEEQTNKQKNKQASKQTNKIVII